MATATKTKAPTVSVTIATFDTEQPVYRPIREGIAISKWKPLTRQDYNPRSGTPLLDATAKFIAHLGEQVKKGRVVIGCLADESGSMGGNEESVIAGINEFVAGMADVENIDSDADGKVVAVIVTDGMENSSREVTTEQLQAMIAQREKEGWTFIYLGSNQEAWAVGRAMAVTSPSSSLYNYISTPAGTASAFRAATMDSAAFLKDTGARETSKSGMITESTISESGEVDGNSPAATKRTTKTTKYDVKSAIVKAKKRK